MKQEVKPVVPEVKQEVKPSIAEVLKPIDLKIVDTSEGLAKGYVWKKVNGEMKPRKIPNYEHVWDEVTEKFRSAKTAGKTPSVK